MSFILELEDNAKSNGSSSYFTSREHEIQELNRIMTLKSTLRNEFSARKKRAKTNPSPSSLSSTSPAQDVPTSVKMVTASSSPFSSVKSTRATQSGETFKLTVEFDGKDTDRSECDRSNSGSSGASSEAKRFRGMFSDSSSSGSSSVSSSSSLSSCSSYDDSDFNKNTKSLKSAKASNGGTKNNLKVSKKKRKSSSSYNMFSSSSSDSLSSWSSSSSSSSSSSDWESSRKTPVTSRKSHRDVLKAIIPSTKDNSTRTLNVKIQIPYDGESTKQELTSSRKVKSGTREATSTQAPTPSSSQVKKRKGTRKGSKNMPWEDQFERLRVFQEENGHCLVNTHLPLGEWVKKQRQQYRLLKEKKKSTMTAARIRLLESIGFTWSVNLDKWDLRFKELVTFKDKYGHCNVSQARSGDQSQKSCPLSKWVHTQRCQYTLMKNKKKTPLTEKRVKLLEDLGFIWNVADCDWDDKFSELKEFKKREGHVNVQARDGALGRWVHTQRAQYRKRNIQKNSSAPSKHTYLTDERIAALESVGFLWKVGQHLSHQIKKEHEERKKNNNVKKNDSVSDPTMPTLTATVATSTQKSKQSSSKKRKKNTSKHYSSDHSESDVEDSDVEDSDDYDFSTESKTDTTNNNIIINQKKVKAGGPLKKRFLKDSDIYSNEKDHSSSSSSSLETAIV